MCQQSICFGFCSLISFISCLTYYFMHRNTADVSKSKDSIYFAPSSFLKCPAHFER